jgi:hypothetical protein
MTYVYLGLEEYPKAVLTRDECIRSFRKYKDTMSNKEEDINLIIIEQEIALVNAQFFLLKKEPS